MSILSRTHDIFVVKQSCITRANCVAERLEEQQGSRADGLINYNTLLVCLIIPASIVSVCMLRYIDKPTSAAHLNNSKSASASAQKAHSRHSRNEGTPAHSLNNNKRYCTSGVVSYHTTLL